MSAVDFLSLNGPDNAGKTTQIRLLAEARPGIQVLGSAHEHAPDLWSVVPEDSATWWFETSTTAELTNLLLESHQLRTEARKPGGLAVIDRGHPMLLATSIATSVIKDDISIDEARDAVLDVVRSAAEPAAEFALLLLISRDVEQSLAVSQERDPSPWSSRYLRYQRTLHEVLMQQVDDGTYDQVIEWDTRTRAQIQAEVLAAADRVAGLGSHVVTTISTEGQ